MGVEGIGARVARKEDKRFITGRGRYTDDMSVPGMKHAAFVRSPHAHAKIEKIDMPRPQGMPGVISVLTGNELAADGIGNLICGWMIKSKDGTPMKMGAWPALAEGHGALCRRRRRRRRRRRQGQARDAAEAVVDRLQGAAGRRRCRQGDRRRARRSSIPKPRATSSTTGRSATQAATDAALRQGQARHQARHRQQPAGPERHGAARRARPLRSGRGPLHLLDDQPEPACRAAGACAPSTMSRRRTSCASSRRMSAAASARRSSSIRKRSSASGPRRRPACR